MDKNKLGEIPILMKKSSTFIYTNSIERLDLFLRGYVFFEKWHLELFRNVKYPAFQLSVVRVGDISEIITFMRLIWTWRD